MAKMTPSISLLLIAVACCWLMGTTAEENTKNPSRTERQYSLNAGDYAVPYYGPILELPSFSYNTETRAPNYFNRPFFASAPASGERTFQTLVNLISGRPLCPACPNCPTCPSCSICPVMPEQAISVSLAAAECPKTPTTDAFALLPCSRVLAAPKGSIEVAFTADQIVAIGIVAVAPNTQITLTCTTIPTSAKTQAGTFSANSAVISKGFVQVVATGANTGKLVCSWVSS